MATYHEQQKNIKTLEDTLKILSQGVYNKGRAQISVKLTKVQMEEAEVFLPEDIDAIHGKRYGDNSGIIAKTGYSCVNMDSFSAARRVYENWQSGLSDIGSNAGILVLNLANAIRPGGGVRHGMVAQEEDLCRRSSLLLSLESQAAKKYYDYNIALHSRIGSDAIIITPNVEIIKDEKGNLLDDTFVVSVMTCAAPDISNGIDELTTEQYQTLMRNRIDGMLKVAAFFGYKRLILGAFGCGVFKNDADFVSDTFYQSFKEFCYEGRKAQDCFTIVDFAVLDHTEEQKNYKAFSRNFNDFYRDEQEKENSAVLEAIKKTEVHLDQIRGCLAGGAAGDALGFTVEFDSESQIFGRYGKNGITKYNISSHSGKALISDDTQMTLFTANGILFQDTRIRLRGIGADPHVYVADAYRDWFKTQNASMKMVNSNERYTEEGGYSWLLDVPELYARRAPGNTCLSALAKKTDCDDHIKSPVNDSKGCGGVMRVAPLALKYRLKENCFSTIEELDMEGARLAAITHGHSLGYMPAAVLTHIISRIISPQDTLTLKQIVLEAKDTVNKIFTGDKHLGTLNKLIDRAVALSENQDSDLDNIHKLGKGWVAEETLAISIYCALRHQNDFSAGIIAAVNHEGDSDSTGAVTGNILGALLGYDAMEDKWKQNLELLDVILEIADDLCHGCQMDEYGSYEDEAWTRKYCYGHRPERKSVKEEQKKSAGYTFFWKDNEKNGKFSNWYKRTFVIDDFEYLHVEQYIMAQKAKHFHDSKHYTQILRATTPWECKDLGRKVTPYVNHEWEEVRYEIALEGNRAKYEQNPDLMELLLATGDSYIAEASPKDSVWGIGIDAAEASRTKREDWPGMNLLGGVLMQLRKEYRSRNEKKTVIRTVLGDITKDTDAEVIVNDADVTLIRGGITSRAIHEAAGSGLTEECRNLNGCELGKARMTDAYDLPCKKVIHTVGPKNSREHSYLIECYANCLELAKEHGFRSIAFPSISIGEDGPIGVGYIEEAVYAVLRFTANNPDAFDLIEWVLPDRRLKGQYDELILHMPSPVAIS